MALEWLDTKHKVFKANVDAWARNERRLRGGDEVLGELRRFDWEQEGGDSYRARQAQAVYLNFPEEYAGRIVGHLTRQAPQAGGALSFGGLGVVPRIRGANPSLAELIYYNADGVGNDGSQWNNFWASAFKRALATGHRWIMVEAPQTAPTNRAQVLNGLRPYLVEFSPTRVPYWHYKSGSLQFIIVRVPQSEPKLDGDELVESEEDGYLLMVRAGFAGLGNQYVRGGWWLFDNEKVLKQQGDWSRTRGEIPCFPLFAERDTGSKERPAISRPALTELGQAAVSYMNLSSAADFDAWDAASSITWLTGVSKEAFNLADQKIRDGSRFVPIPSDTEGPNPSVHDGSMGAVAGTVFDSRMRTKRTEVEGITGEVSGTADSSGASKRAGFADNTGPRISLFASEMEQAQNTAIHFLELRGGVANPSGSTKWPRDFDLIPASVRGQAVMDLQVAAQRFSKTLTANILVLVARENGWLEDDETEEAVRNELMNAPDPILAKLAKGNRTTTTDKGSGTGGDTTPPATNPPATPANPLPDPVV